MSVYEVVTDRIVSSLENGVIPWKREWKTSGKTGGLPYNLQSGAAYRGVNVLTLLCSGFSANGWCTYKQAQSLGYQVRKGEKSSPVVFWKFPTKAELLANPDKAPFARMYSVFNIAQLDGVPVELPFEGEPFDAIAECETAVSAFMASDSHPTLGHGGDRAFYRPLTDHVQMPHRETFNSPGGYYATLFHEFAHSTGPKFRLNRPEFDGSSSEFGNETYSREELTAEFASAFLCAETGCSNEERIANSVAYIQSWIKKLKNDKTMAVQAAQKAQKAADFILLRRFGLKESEETA